MPLVPARENANGDPARADIAALGLRHKTFDCQFKAVDENGGFELYAAVFGNVDRQGDLIEPGAFKNLPEFSADGFGLLNHMMFQLPVAMVDEATQDSYGLKISGRFHGTPEAQAVRTVIRERMAAGKSVKCSIGYLTTAESFEKTNGQTVRRIKGLSVYEFSFVNLPANPAAEVTAAKSISLPTEEPMETITDKANAAMKALKEWLGGIETKGEAKPMSKAGMTRMKAFAEAMDEHGGATREHAKSMHEHGKAACAMGKEMKAFLKSYDPDNDGDDDSTEEGDTDNDAAAVAAKPKPKKPGGKKVEEPEHTADADPPKSKKDATLTVYAETLKHRSLLGRRHQACP